MVDKSKHFSLQLNMPIFGEYQTPIGFLPREKAAHALMYYALTARQTYEDVVQGHELVYEGNLDPVANFRQMFTSIADLYEVAPEQMAKFWPNVDMQFTALELPHLPKEERYRFDGKLIIRSH